MHDFHEGRSRGSHEHHAAYGGRHNRRFRAESDAERDARGWGGGMSPGRSEDPRAGADPRETGRGRGEGRGDGMGEGRGDGRGEGRSERRAERHEQRGHRHDHRGRGRAQRGDVRAAVLILLATEPMHGYQMMHAITERTGGTWRVSPGAIYPTIAQLEDEGLVRTELEAGRKLVVLTDAGRSYIEDAATAPTDPFSSMTDAGGNSFRDVFEGLATASKTLGRTGTPTQVAAAREVLEKARRELYLILADDPGAKS